MRIAILGAESTGKSQLASELADALRAQGTKVALVAEYLREWCDLHGRTPRAAEQALIAHEQVRRVDAGHATVIADTTALMTSVYSELLFNDASLHNFAAAHQRSYDITLVTGLDLPWIADGIQRDGPHTRERTDSLLRSALNRASLPYRVVYGTGGARLKNAVQALENTKYIANYSIRTSEICNFSHTKQKITDVQTVQATWVWPCDKCSDPDCEHQLFSRLLKETSPAEPTVNAF